MIYFVVVSLAFAGEPALVSAPVTLYRATIQCPGGEIPFGLEIEESSPPRAWVINGRERMEVPSVSVRRGGLVLDFEYYDSQIDAVIEPPNQDGKRRLRGTWRKRIDKEKSAELPFAADAGVRDRFLRSASPKNGGANPTSIEGRWAVRFSKSEDPAVGVFTENSDGTVEGTFLTPTGDYRFLAGDFADGRLRLSCFDGSHAFLFDARVQRDGTLAGNFWSRDAWHETWTAQRDENAALPDGFRATSAVSGVDLNRLSFPDLNGKTRSLADPEFAGKARIIEIFGSWCPNCNDESAYLAELDRRYRSRGLRIVGLAFEASGDFDRDARQAARFVRRHGVEYPVLIAGTKDREKASKALPMLDRLRAFPTTIFLDGKGNVRAVYTGFSGPATGREYDELKRQFERTIESLLAE